MNQINDPALEYGAGTQFDYSVWEPGTRVSLFSVPWDSVYRDTWFPGEDNATPVQRRAMLNTYLDSLESPQATMTGGSPVRIDIPVRIPLSHNRAMRYNYLRARNPLIATGANPGGDVQKDYYYFILNARYVNPGMTELTLQLDLWQTFMYDTVIGNSYVEQGHVGIANSRQMDNNGRDFLTVPEGIDTGGEYRIAATKRELLRDPQTGDKYNVLVCSAVDLFKSGGEQGNNANPPRMVTSPGGRFQGIPSGAQYYVLRNASALETFMDFVADKPWMSQAILSITLIPPMTRYYNFIQYNGDARLGGAMTFPQDIPPVLYRDLFPNWRDNILSQIPERYRHLKKLLTFPYMAIELTTFTGTPIILRPEAWNNPNASVVERASLMPPSQKVIWFPRFYNTTGTPIASIDADDPGEYYDLMTQIAGFPSVALVNNAHIGYLASNQNAINQSYAAADWAQQRALRGAQTGYDQAAAGIGAQRAQTEAANQYAGASQAISQDLARQNQMYNAIGGAGLGGAAGLAAGPVGGAAGLAGGAGAGVLGALTLNNTLSAQTQQLGAQINQAWRSTDISTDQSQLVADSNRALAEFGAKGDYQQTIAALDAKVQDTKLLQPSTSGQTAGDFMHLVHNSQQIAARWKMIDPAAMATVCEHWLEFGYSVHRRYTPPASLAVMSKFTYWRFGAANLRVANIPEGFRNALRGILEKGVKVWRDPRDISNTDLGDNDPLTGIALPTYAVAETIAPVPVLDESIEMAYSIIANSAAPGETLVASQLTGESVIVTSPVHVDLLNKFKTGQGVSMLPAELEIVRGYIREINESIVTP